VNPQQKYGIALDQMSDQGANAARAAERTRARTFIYRDTTPIGAIVPIEDVERLDPPDPGQGGSDPLLSLCGSCRHDSFVDALRGDFSKTVLFQPGQAAAALAEIAAKVADEDDNLDEQPTPPSGTVSPSGSAVATPNRSAAVRGGISRQRPPAKAAAPASTPQGRKKPSVPPPLPNPNARLNRPKLGK